jgi:hypothetical protein
VAYHPCDEVTIESFHQYLMQWDGRDSVWENILAGMMTILKNQGLEDQVNELVIHYHNR